MVKATVADFAVELKVTPEKLLEQLKAAGVIKSAAGDAISEKDKTQMLDHMREQHGRSEAKTRITITRKQTSEIKKSDSATGKARTIQVEVRKKRVLVKRDSPDEVEAEVVVPVVEQVPEPIVEIIPEPVVIAEAAPEVVAAPAAPSISPPPNTACGCQSTQLARC